MRDLDALLNSLVNIDRNSLVAIPISQAEAESGWSTLLDSARSQRAKRHEAEQRATRIDRILSFFQQGDVAPDLSEGDIQFSKSVEQKLQRIAK